MDRFGWVAGVGCPPGSGADGHAFFFCHYNSEDAMEYFEHAGHHAIERRLATAKDDAESTPADLIGVGESGSTQLRDDGRAHVSLR